MSICDFVFRLAKETYSSPSPDRLGNNTHHCTKQLTNIEIGKNIL
jgi:hypothetical protein